MTDSELTDTTVSSNDEEYFEAMSEEEFGEDGNLQTAFEPYQDEPLASSSDEDEDNGVAEAMGSMGFRWKPFRLALKNGKLSKNGE